MLTLNLKSLNGYQFWENHYSDSGKPSEAKDTAKIKVRKDACLLLRHYLYMKDLMGMNSEVKNITNIAALFIGRLLSISELIESEAEYIKRVHSKNANYQKFLSNSVTTILRDEGKKFEKK